MSEAAKYATAFALRKAWAAWNEGERALMLYMTGLTRDDVMSVNLQMIQLQDLPNYRKIDKSAVLAKLQEQLKEKQA